MNRGKAILNWSEPRSWNQAARSLAKDEGVSSFPWLSWSGVLFLVGGLIILEWSDADPTTRASIPELVGIISTLFGFLFGLGWFFVRLNRTDSTAIHEGGLIHGSRMKKQWIPWDQIQYFYTDEDSIGSLTFRFLSWQQEGHEDESFSVVPDTIDLETAIQHFKTNQVEQVAAPNP